MQLKLNLHEANLNFTLLKTTISRQQREILVKKIQICITCSNNLTKIHTNAKSPICLPSSHNI